MVCKNIISTTRPAFPLKASMSGSYLVDQNNTPFLYHADTPWRMQQRLTPDEIQLYLNDRKMRGFNTIHIHAINKEMEGPLSSLGQAPFSPENDLTKPNELYWRQLDNVLDYLNEKDFFIAISASWFGYLGSGWKPDVNLHSAKIYGEFLGKRYNRFCNIMWILGGDNNPEDKYEATSLMAAAIRKMAPHHLLTYHAQAECSSEEWFHEDSWLDVNMCYTYKAAFEHLETEYNRAGRARPSILGETGYEGESNTGFTFTPALMRRQAYWSMLSGVCGQAVGFKHVWRFSDEWMLHLDRAPVQQMTLLKNLFTSLEWWKLVPDFDHTFVSSGYLSMMNSNNTACAVAGDGSFALVYLPSSRPIVVELKKLGYRVKANWFDPVSGNLVPVAQFSTQESGQQVFTPPEFNAAGDEDWVLVLFSDQYFPDIP